ncbi:DNase I-like protein [Acephala macrosclerotiorum]|nr:DNase I-like protein [Acephala macrosclerotiorum]
MDSGTSVKKRRRPDDDKISPPPLRRKRDVDASETSTEFEEHKASTNTIPAEDSFQIYSWNVNSITHLLPKTQKSIKSFFVPPSPQGEDESEEENSKLVPLREFLRRHKWPQFLGLQEVKISPKDESTKRAVEKAANGDGDPTYKAYFSLPRDKYNATGWGERGRSIGIEGRVLVTEIPAFQNLVIINSYWVNGTMNSYRSPETGVVISTRHDRKRQFHSLMLEVKSYQAKGWEVIFVGDMNVARTPLDGYPGIRLGSEHDEDGMHAIDTWRWIHGNKRGYSYHGENAEDWRSSCDRVDLGIVTRGLVDKKALVGAEIYESVAERGGSDHVPISMVLSARRIMDDAATRKSEGGGAT